MASAPRPEELHGSQTYRPRPGQDHIVTHLERRLCDSPICRSHRIEQDGILERDVVGNGIQHLLGRRL